MHVESWLDFWVFNLIGRYCRIDKCTDSSVAANIGGDCSSGSEEGGGKIRVEYGETFGSSGGGLSLLDYQTGAWKLVLYDL